MGLQQVFCLLPKMKIMTLSVKALLTFIGLTPELKVTFGKGVITGIGNTIAKFTNLPYTILELTGFNNALNTAIASAALGLKTSKSDLKTAIKNWNNAFRQTANYVSVTAAGDENVIINAGFEASKATSSAGVLPTLFLVFKLVASTVKGLFRASVAPIKGVKNLTYVFVSSPAGVVITQINNTLVVTSAGVSTYIKIGTSHAVAFSNLPAIPMNVTAFGVNNKGMGPMNTSLPITTQ